VSRNQADRTLGSIPDHQSFDLPDAQSEAFSRSARLQFPIDDRLDGLQPLEISHVSCNPQVAHDGQAPKSLNDLGKHGPKPQNTTFVSSWNRTFLNGCYNQMAHNYHYVKSQITLVVQKEAKFWHEAFHVRIMCM
jgi:hypothetical protein